MHGGAGSDSLRSTCVHSCCLQESSTELVLCHRHGPHPELAWLVAGLLEGLAERCCGMVGARAVVTSCRMEGAGEHDVSAATHRP